MENQELTIFEEGQVLLFDKPVYWTSFDLVNKVRGIIRNVLQIKKIKVGHAGTLDPLASGLMIVCTGKATKTIDTFQNLDKEYTASFHLGETTPSFDLETETDAKYPTNHINKEMVEKALLSFLGEQQQLPPIYSAKLLDGKRAYEYARKGIDKKLEPVTVFFREIELLSYNFPEISVRIVCSKGTYIRSFARDLGVALDSGSYLSALVRNSIGPYKLSEAYKIENFQNFVEQMKPF